MGRGRGDGKGGLGCGVRRDEARDKRMRKNGMRQHVVKDYWMKEARVWLDGARGCWEDRARMV